MAQGALQWLNRLCALYTKHAPAVQSCHAEVHSSGAVVSLTVAGGTVQLLLKPKGEGKSYAQTAPLAVSLQPRPEDSTLDAREAEQIARGFIEVLVRADKGNIDVAPALPPENHGQAERVLVDPEASLYELLQQHQLDSSALRLRFRFTGDIIKQEVEE